MNRNAVDLVLLQKDESQSAELRSTRGDEAEMEPDQGIRRHSPLPLLAAVDILPQHKSLPFSPSRAGFDHALLQPSFRLIYCF